ncbi:polyprenyl synthetase family protein [Azospirillum sp. HJ39]|uniref:polyprenyl synthetase family protein n=1 Tax=Azospirillum sp. HJ39 TaxID=3159496 RepID=UPI003556A67A
MPLKLAIDSRKGGSDPISEIYDGLLADDMAAVHRELEAAMIPQARYLTDAEIGIYRRGKKLRPMLMVLSARMLAGADAPPSPRVVKGAASLEMLHVATLIHDDVIDRSMVRRGMPSVNAARGAETAIIIGDMQFVQALRGFIDTITVPDDMELVRLVLDTAFRICCGELDELQTDPRWDFSVLRSRYLATIERKTSVLFGLACEAGLSLAGGRRSDCRRIGTFGRRLGDAFQIMDDVFDFLQDERQSGKPVGMDLTSRRVSLPLIYAMEELGPNHAVTRFMRGGACDPAELAEAIEAVKSSNAIQRAYADARAKALEALSYLQPFPDNRYQRALQRLTHHVVDRGY